MPFLTDSAIDREELVNRIYRSSDGAVVIFEGVVRNHHEGRSVRSIFYEAYRPMAEREIERIIGEVRAQFPAVVIALQHRLGLVMVGEVSITIVCCAPHRADAYDASRKLIDEVKRRVPIWKKEETAEGSVWQGWQK